MDRNLSEKIWRRDNAREIMREARRQFRIERYEDLPTACVTLASVHYSLVKRYTGHSWQWPLAVWHMWRAVENAHKAIDASSLGISEFSIDEIDVMATIWRKAPWWLGGDLYRAEKAILFALSRHPNAASMKPHTRALLFISLGDIRYRNRQFDNAWDYYRGARRLVSLIEHEDAPDRERQLSRVLTAVGFFYYDHGGNNTAEREDGIAMLQKAARLAGQVSLDQQAKIVAEWRKRGIG